MNTDQIVTALIAERDRLNRAIEVLQGPMRRGRPPKNPMGATAPTPTSNGHKRGGMSVAAKRAQSRRMKAYWAKRRKEGTG